MIVIVLYAFNLICKKILAALCGVALETQKEISQEYEKLYKVKEGIVR